MLEQLTAGFTLSWTDGVELARISVGSFDLGAPAYRQVITVPGASVETRVKAGHTWTQVTGPDIHEDVAACWMHFTTGRGRQGLAAAVPPVALMLIEPTAVGFRAGSDEDVVVDLLLDEATPAMMPKVANQLGWIDPTAKIQGVATVRDGRYAALEFSGADVIAAFDSEELPTALGEFRGVLASTRIRVEYGDFGATVQVPEPDAVEVIDFGSQAEILASPPPSDEELETCAANR